jgi:hypothetical protein
MKNFDTPMGAAGGAAGGGGAAPTKNGQLEVALSVQAVSGLVKVDPSQMPFTTTPDGLFLLAFNDNKVGISDDQMAFFKATLKGFLPEIGEKIDGIAEDASQIIGDVAEIVWLAEEAHSQ